MRAGTLKIFLLGLLLWPQTGWTQSICSSVFEPKRDYLGVFMDSVLGLPESEGIADSTESPIATETVSQSKKASAESVSQNLPDITGLAVLGHNQDDIEALRLMAAFLMVRPEYSAYNKPDPRVRNLWNNRFILPLNNWTPSKDKESDRQPGELEDLTPSQVALMTLLISAHDSKLWESAVIIVNRLLYDAGNTDLGMDMTEQQLLSLATRSRDVIASWVGTEIPENWQEELSQSQFVQQSEARASTRRVIRAVQAPIHRLSWSRLNENLSDAEIQLFIQVLSWDVPTRSLRDTLRELRAGGPALTELTGIRHAESGPRTVSETWAFLYQTFLLELATQDLQAETLTQMERFLSLDWDADEAFVIGTLDQWRPLLNWARSNPTQAYELVRDALEFRRIYPEIR